MEEVIKNKIAAFWDHAQIQTRIMYIFVIEKKKKS